MNKCYHECFHAESNIMPPATQYLVITNYFTEAIDNISSTFNLDFQVLYVSQPAEKLMSYGGYCLICYMDCQSRQIRILLVLMNPSFDNNKEIPRIKH